jgi:2'-5' RNA ligase
VSAFFLACLLGEERGRRVAAAVRATLEGARHAPGLPRPEGLHMTLLYLGESPPERNERLAAALAPRLAGLAAPRLLLRASGAFPRPGSERVLWVGVEEEPAAEGRLAAVHEQVLACAEELALDTSSERQRRFRPHVSVARPRRAGAVPRAFYELVLAEPWSPDAVHLMESVAGDGPRRYVSRAALALAPGA